MYRLWVSAGWYKFLYDCHFDYKASERNKKEKKKENYNSFDINSLNPVCIATVSYNGGVTNKINLLFLSNHANRLWKKSGTREGGKKKKRKDSDNLIVS